MLYTSFLASKQFSLNKSHVIYNTGKSDVISNTAIKYCLGSSFSSIALFPHGIKQTKNLCLTHVSVLYSVSDIDNIHNTLPFLGLIATTGHCCFLTISMSSKDFPQSCVMVSLMLKKHMDVHAKGVMNKLYRENATKIQKSLSWKSLDPLSFVCFYCNTRFCLF